MSAGRLRVEKHGADAEVPLVEGGERLCDTKFRGGIVGELCVGNIVPELPLHRGPYTAFVGRKHVHS